ncbi:MAG: hypothetical protein ACUVXA_06920 [Candidatus Jordarchaeum sp.]|uniref:hypothetical protein n=1 Tax=Candidatus Jordarchaeum sp. TaxID=2823881 RepID=UPI004049E4C2
MQWFRRAKDISREVKEEFELTSKSLAERTERVPEDKPTELAKIFNCPMSLSKVAYQLELDGVMRAEKALELLLWEYNRRKQIGSPVVPVLSYEFDFAVKEGRWIEYLYSDLFREIQKTRELYNLEKVIEGEHSIPVEKVMHILSEREKLANNYLVPVIKKWKKTHEASTNNDVAITLCAAVLKTSHSEAIIALQQAKRRLIRILRKFSEAFELSTDKSIFDSDTVFKQPSLIGKKLSEEVASPLEKIYVLIDELEKSLQAMTEYAIAEIILEITPKPIAVEPTVGVSDYLIVTPPILRDGMVGPDLKEPCDFLERDLVFAKRRVIAVKENFLRERIRKVHKALQNKGQGIEESAAWILHKISQDFSLTPMSTENALKFIKKELENKEGDLNELVEKIITDYLWDKIVLPIQLEEKEA